MNDEIDFSLTKGDIGREILFVLYVFAMGALCGFGVGAFFV